MRLLLKASSALAGLLTLLLASCSLTKTDVEPEVPSGQLNADNTLVYYANGQPVVAHNYGNLGTVFLSLVMAAPLLVSDS